MQPCTSLRMRMSASQPCAITARFKYCQSGNTVNVRASLLVATSSPRVGDAREVNNKLRAGRAGCARRDRVAVHSMACSSAAAQRDASWRGVCILVHSRWLATLSRCTCGRAVPAVRSRTALGLRIFVHNAHCDARFLAERGQMLLIARKLQHKQWHSADLQRRWSFGLYK